MDNKLIDIEAQGHDTANIMRNANVKLRDQRDVIINVADKNQNMSDNLKVAATTIR